MMDELYIDGERVELNDTGISLNYKSNLLTDISKIVSNNSYTIKAPRTTANMRLINGFVFPSTVGDYPYRSHSAVVVRDGIEIISGATVYLLSVGEDIEFCLVWGVGSRFENIKNKKLTEMPVVDGDTVVWLPDNPAYADNYLDINYGIDFPPPTAPKMPHITVYDLLVRIFQSNGISMMIDDPNVENNLKSLAVPLTNRNDCLINSSKYVTSVFSDQKSISRFVPEGFFDSVDLLFVGSENRSNVYGVWTYSPSLEGIVGYRPTYDQSITLSGTVRCRYAGGYRIILVIYKANEIDGSNDEITRIEGITEGYDVSFPIERVEIDLNGFEAGTTMRFMIAVQTNNIVSDIFANIEVSPLFDMLVPGLTDYYIVPNLPDMKQIDFIKGVCQMFNYYAYSGNDGIYINSFGRLISNKSKAVDWSGKIVGETEMSFTVDGINQVNIVKYKEDDTVIGNYDSQFVVNNQALDPEGDFISLPFAACDTRIRKAVVPIYSYDSNGELEIEDNSIPRIVRIKDQGGKTMGVFEGLDWNSLLNTYYRQYISTIGQAKVISCDMILNCIDLKNLDMSIPVYIGELGGYFGIVEIKTKKNDISEVSLIKI
jgi:hypothetical protein